MPPDILLCFPAFLKIREIVLDDKDGSMTEMQSLPGIF